MQIWQIADSENRGLLTPAGFGIVLRLIGYAQSGRPVSAELALKREWILGIRVKTKADRMSQSRWTATQVRWHYGSSSIADAGPASAGSEQWAHQSSSIDSG